MNAPLSDSAWADLAERLPPALQALGVGVELRRAPGDTEWIRHGALANDRDEAPVLGHPGVLLTCSANHRPWLAALVAGACDLVLESESLSCELAASYGKLALLEELGHSLSGCAQAAAVGRVLATSIGRAVPGSGRFLQRQADGRWCSLAAWGAGVEALSEQHAADLETLAGGGRAVVHDAGTPPSPLQALGAMGPICAVPVHGPECVEGLLVMTREDRPFASDEIMLLELAAAQGALALDRLRREASLRAAAVLEHDLAVAGRIQQNLLPERLPDLPGYSLAARLQPARHIGGDAYDVVVADSGCWLLVADVSGHSIPAALAMSMVRTATRSILPTVDGPGALLHLLDQQLGDDLQRSTLFVSLAVVLLDPISGRFRVASAGHPPPLHRDPDGRCAVWDVDGAIIGLGAGLPFAESCGQLAPGESLLLYTDGIVDQTCVDHGQPLAWEGVATALAGRRGPADDLLETVHQHLAGHCRNDAEDDTTLLIVARHPPSGLDQAPVGV